MHAGGNEAHASAGPSVQPNLGGLDKGPKKRVVILDPRAVDATQTTTIPNDLAVEFIIDMMNDTLLEKEVKTKYASLFEDESGCKSKFAAAFEKFSHDSKLKNLVTNQNGKSILNQALQHTRSGKVDPGMVVYICNKRIKGEDIE